MIEIVLELFGDVLLQVVLQVLAEVGVHSWRGLRDPDGERPPANPVLATLGYLLFGTIVGGLSLFFRPELLLAPGKLRWLNLVVTPLISGLVMMAMGAWRRRRDQPLVRMDRFAYGYTFAFAASAARFFVAG
ncbi:hypothetical protein DZC73_28505 [Albitalea terrae]|uniref:Uncharacterized protein n=1 Tax=Piscinibacter terrae TaxID=2496871 RepID=A0A3N7HIY7_9BURK|nr:hypothetical protein DZC73_28505 [Albitalea terrae]